METDLKKESHSLDELFNSAIRSEFQLEQLCARIKEYFYEKYARPDLGVNFDRMLGKIMRDLRADKIQHHFVFFRPVLEILEERLHHLGGLPNKPKA